MLDLKEDNVSLSPFKEGSISRLSKFKEIVSGKVSMFSEKPELAQSPDKLH